MKKRASIICGVLLSLSLCAGCLQQGLRKGSMMTVGMAGGNSSQNTASKQVPDPSFREEEYQKLWELQLPGYKEMSISEYRSKVGERTDTKEYADLLERFWGSALLEASMEEDETASFLFYILPLTGEHWKTRTFSGAVSTSFPAPVENAMLEYILTMTIQDADTLTVGEYDAVRVGVASALQELLLGKTEEELQRKEGIREADLDAIIRQWEDERLELSIEYTYLPLSLPEPGEKKEQDSFQEERKREYPNATAEDYRSLLALKTPDYQKLSVAEFNQKLLEWANEDTDRMGRIDCDMRYEDCKVLLTEEERNFLLLSVKFSGMENGKYVQSQYTGRTEDDPVFSQDLPEKTEKGNNRFVWCDLYYQFSYHISDKEKLSVGERDRCLYNLMTEIQHFWEKTEIDTLLKLEKSDLTAKLKRIALSSSTDNMTITICEDQVAFEKIVEDFSDKSD